MSLTPSRFFHFDYSELVLFCQLNRCFLNLLLGLVKKSFTSRFGENRAHFSSLTNHFDDPYNPDR